jgi:hypothetical protein
VNFRHLYTEVVKVVLLPGIAVLLLAAATVTPAAAHIVQWRDAHATYDAAAARAAGVSEDHAAALGLWNETVDGATLTLEDATGVASAGTGYLSAAALTELTAANTALSQALEAEQPEGTEVPDADRAGTLAEVRAAADRVEEWSVEEEGRVSELDGQTTDLTALRDSVDEAATAAAKSVSTESGLAFGVAPIATAETRTAVEVARDALVVGASKGETLKDLVTAYGAAVEAMFASQRAEAEAAAAREAEAEAEARVPLEIVWPDFPPFEPCAVFVCEDGIVVGVG